MLVRHDGVAGSDLQQAALVWRRKQGLGSRGAVAEFVAASSIQRRATPPLLIVTVRPWTCGIAQAADDRPLPRFQQPGHRQCRRWWRFVGEWVARVIQATSVPGPLTIMLAPAGDDPRVGLGERTVIDEGSIVSHGAGIGRITQGVLPLTVRTHDEGAATGDEGVPGVVKPFRPTWHCRHPPRSTGPNRWRCCSTQGCRQLH